MLFDTSCDLLIGVVDLEVNILVCVAKIEENVRLGGNEGIRVLVGTDADYLSVPEYRRRHCCDLLLKYKILV